MLATSTASHRTGAIGLLNALSAEGDAQAIGLGHGALAKGFEGTALATKVEDGLILEVAATELETPWAHPGRYGFLTYCGDSFWHGLAPVISLVSDAPGCLAKSINPDVPKGYGPWC